jgi:hypothetical protein
LLALGVAAASCGGRVASSEPWLLAPDGGHAACRYVLSCAPPDPTSEVCDLAALQARLCPYGATFSWSCANGYALLYEPGAGDSSPWYLLDGTTVIAERETGAFPRDWACRAGMTSVPGCQLAGRFDLCAGSSPDAAGGTGVILEFNGRSKRADAAEERSKATPTEVRP